MMKPTLVRARRCHRRIDFFTQKGFAMKELPLVAATGAAIMTGPAVADVLVDNGPVNGVGAYSNATSGVFGFRRTILDDFTVPAGGWTLQEMHWNSVWGTPMGGAMGIGAEISLRSDLSGTPGTPFLTTNLTGYSEVHTGNILFSREEVTHWASFDDVVLGAGTYWFEATVQGPENNFWLTADHRGHECWVNYEDLGGLSPGSEQFGVASDINFMLSGLPAPGALGLLGLAGLARVRNRRRRCEAVQSEPSSARLRRDGEAPS